MDPEARALHRVNGVLVALLVLHAASFAPGSYRSLGTQEWGAVSNRYCSKRGGSAPLLQNTTRGFGLTWTTCRSICRRTPECKMFTFGRWERSLASVFSKHHRKQRCQLYAQCKVERRKGMTVFIKPASLKRAWPSFMRVTAVSANALALFESDLAAVCLVVMVALAAVAGSHIGGPVRSPPAEVLTAAYALNAFVLLAARRCRRAQLARESAMQPKKKGSVIWPTSTELSPTAKLVVDLTEVRDLRHSGKAGKAKDGKGGAPQSLDGDGADLISSDEELDLTALR